MIEKRYIVTRKRGGHIVGIYKNRETATEWIDEFDFRSDFYIDEINWEE